MGVASTRTDEIRFHVSTLEADIAFFEARLSLAGESPETVYQLAQIKTYQTLCQILGQTLATLKPKKRQKKRAVGTDP